MKKSKLVIICLTGIWLSFNSVSLIGQNRSQIDETLSKYLHIQNKRIGFSGTVLVADDDGIISHQTIGLASRELEVPFSIDSRFKIASITKSFTGLLITLAEKEGKLRLENNLGTYFPKLKDETWKQITIKQLLSHTSGVPHWSGFDEYWTIKSWLPLTQEQVLDEIFNMELLFEPGTNASYSSPAYYLLAIILEKVYAANYKHILEGKILTPLQLKHTNAFDGLSIIPGMSSGYHLISDDSLIAAPPRNMATMKGGGHLYATATDLNTWCRSFLSNDIWKDSIHYTTFNPITNFKMQHKKGAFYARGWYISEKNSSGSAAYHVGGGTFGFSSKAVIYPSHKISMVILSNVSFLPMDDVLWKDIEKIVFEKPFELPKEYPAILNLTSHELKKFSGIYKSKNGLNLEIIFHRDKLFTKLGRNPPFEIYPQSQNTFFSKKIEIEFTFTTNDGGGVTGLATNGMGRIDHFEKQ